MSQQNEFYYKMDHKCRGHAIIFSHKNFGVNGLTERCGTEEDAQKLNSTLKGLDFKVETPKLLKKEDVLKKMDEYAAMDHTNNDCFVMCICTHGNGCNLYCEDDYYKLEDVLKKFSPKNCKSLEGKPKLFFIQACQGKKEEHSCEVKYEIDSVVIKRHHEAPPHEPSPHEAPPHEAPPHEAPPHETPPHEPPPHEAPPPFSPNMNVNPELNRHQSSNTSLSLLSYRLPIYEDFLVALSTFPGFIAWRTDKGTPFIQYLCRVLDNKAYDDDLLTLLTIVNQAVAEQYEHGEYKQMPFIQHKLTGLVSFTFRKDPELQTEH